MAAAAQLISGFFSGACLSAGSATFSVGVVFGFANASALMEIPVWCQRAVKTGQ
jgi:hypothetical protein